MQLNQCINYLLTNSQHKVFQIMSNSLAPYDVTPVQYGVLYCLWELNKNNPKDIAEELRLENSTISGVLERMEKKQLIVREISDEDRRFIKVALTPKAEALREEVLSAVENVNNEVMKSFSDEEGLMLKKSLKIIADLPR